MTFARRFICSLVLLPALGVLSPAQDTAVSLTISNGTAVLNLPRVPGTDQYKVLSAPDVNVDFSVLNSGAISGFTWTNGVTSSQGFFRAMAVPMPQNDLLAGLLLNRLAYGPTPDELERVKAIGADPWIAEQLAPETIAESLPIDQINTTREWQRVVVTGVPTAADFYIYLTAVGDVYIDDLKVVRGASPDVGANLFVDGDFETWPAAWTVSTNFTDSIVSTTEVHSGANSLHVIASAAGSGKTTAIWQTVANLALNQVYTLSYWWKPGTNLVSNLTMRFSGSGITTSADTPVTKLATRVGRFDADLRNWHLQHAVKSKKQLQEVLLQFLENHFVTQATKTRDYFDRYYDNGEDEMVSANLEYREIERWRQALNSPSCTFSNLLTISAESPAQIIYLDTVGSRGDGGNIPNENYARELLELYTFGVDNGYDQTDITLMSRPWSGWTVEIVDPGQELNPLAPRSQTLRPGGTNVANIENLAGNWAFSYRTGRHWDQGPTVLFPGKTVPDRFGAPYAGKNYELQMEVPAFSPDWQRVTMTGTASSSTLYMYLTAPGDLYIDDVSIVAGSVPESGANFVSNGGFESNLTSWVVSANHSQSIVETVGAHTGTRALHMVASAGGTGQTTSIYHTGLGLVNGQTYTLSFWCKPGSSAGTTVTLRLSGSGLSDTGPAKSPDTGLSDGYKVIAHLANQPFTQEFISVKLCRLFVHDNFVHGVYDYRDPDLSPEGKLVRACMDAWENSAPKGNIREVLKVIFNSELFRSQAAAGHKVKTPLEFTASSIRALRSDNGDGTFTAEADPIPMKDAIVRMGAMRLFDRAEPDGYPEQASPWISAGTLAERLRWVQALCIAPGTAGRPGDAGSSTANPVALLKKKLPSTQWNNAGAVADYFLGILMPTEGKANLDLYRTAAINFLNTADNGTTASPFANLVSTTTVYDTRVRGMVAAIMTSPRFHEQ